MLRLLLLCLFLSAPALAQPRLPVLGAGGTTGGVTYTGPGDIVASATAWYGLRAYSAAVAATGTQKSLNIRRASDNSTQDIVILTTGAFDIASYNTFVGTDTTGSCTIASTTLTCTGLGSTLHVSDPISGAGIGQPCYLTAVGSFSAGAQTATINSATLCGSVGVAVTVTAQVAGFAAKFYDQSGGGLDASQATAGNQPQLLPTCLKSSALPCLSATGSSYYRLTFITVAQPLTISVVSERTGSTSSYACIMCYNGGAQSGHNNAVNQIFMYAGGGVPTATASDNVLHALQYVFNGGSSILNVDGSGSSVSNGATGFGNGANTTGIFTLGDGSSYLMTGFLGEVGLWPVGFSAGNNTSMRANQSAYWGTP